MANRFLFIGERRSNRAITMRVTWKDGRLAACTLFKALVACGISPGRCGYQNLWDDDGELNPNTVRLARHSVRPVVALGQKVSRKLTKLGIGHRRLVHPAARGTIRTTTVY